MIARDVFDAAALNRGAHRPPAVAVKAKAGADAYRFHGKTVRRCFSKSKRLVRFAKHDRVILEAAQRLSGIHKHDRCDEVRFVFMDSGLAASPRPGMTRTR